MIDYAFASCNNFIMYISDMPTEEEICQSLLEVFEHPKFKKKKTALRVFGNHSKLWTPPQIEKITLQFAKYAPKQIRYLAQTPASREAGILAKGISRDHGFDFRLCSKLSELCGGR